MALVENLHYVDDKVFGYRYGYFFWLSLFIVNNIMLGVDDVQGVQRDYLTNTSLMSCLTLVVYFYHQLKGNPSSAAGMQGASVEGLARILYASHCGWSDIVGTNPVGAWNCALLVIASLFTLGKLPQVLHTNFNRPLYLEYVERKKTEGVQ